MKKENNSQLLRNMTEALLSAFEKTEEGPPTLGTDCEILQSAVGEDFVVRTDFLRIALSAGISPFIVRSDGTVTWKDRGWKKRR